MACDLEHLDAKILAKLLSSSLPLESHCPAPSQGTLPPGEEEEEAEENEDLSPPPPKISSCQREVNTSLTTAGSLSSSSYLSCLGSFFSESPKSSFERSSSTLPRRGAPLNRRRKRREAPFIVSLGVTHSEVFLHVYDLHPLTKLAGLQLFHVGVEVHECECSYGSHGLQWVHPGKMGPGHREVVPLGPTHLTAKQVVQLAAVLSKEWRGCDYDIFNNNCQTFSLEFCRMLAVPVPIPEEFVRYAQWR